MKFMQNMSIHLLHTIYYILYTILLIGPLYCVKPNNQITKQQDNQIRIVSLTPSITESLYILGEQKNVVGITTFCRRISKEQKIVGTYLEANIEEIVKLKPDIVFVSKEGLKKEVVENLEKFNIKVKVFEPVNSYEDIKNQLLEIGVVINKKDKAKKIIDEYEQKIKRFLKPKKYLKVLCILSLQPIIVVSNNSYIGEIINYAGGFNIVSSKLKYPQMNLEEIIKLAPDVIILPSMGMEEKEVKNFFVKYKEIPAVKNNKIFVLNSNILCQPTIKNFYLAVKQLSEILNE